MKTFAFSAVLMATCVALSIATTVQNCPKTTARLLEAGDVTVSKCPKDKCTLKRNSVVTMEMKIVPNRDFTELNSDIQGIILDVPLPFPGYYGTSACPHIYDAEGKNQVGCPLKSGKTYIYRNSLKILPIYPPVSVIIHWGLGDKNGDAVCFEIPAKIKA